MQQNLSTTLNHDKKIEGHRADDHPGNAKGGPSDGVYIGVKGNLVQPAIRSLHDL